MTHFVRGVVVMPHNHCNTYYYMYRPYTCTRTYNFLYKVIRKGCLVKDYLELIVLSIQLEDTNRRLSAHFKMNYREHLYPCIQTYKYQLLQPQKASQSQQISATTTVKNLSFPVADYRLLRTRQQWYMFAKFKFSCLLSHTHG